MKKRELLSKMLLTLFLAGLEKQFDLIPKDIIGLLNTMKNYYQSITYKEKNNE